MPTSASTGTEQLSTAGSTPTDDLDSKSKEELQDMLRDQEKPVSGNKDELIARLRDEDAPADTSNVPEQPTDQGGPTSAVTSEAQMEQAKRDAVDEGLRDEPVTEANTVVVDNAGDQRNTPDGAIVVTREEDVVGGVRVDLPPSAPSSPSTTEAIRQGGTVQVTRPDGTQVSLDSNDPDFEKKAEQIRAGERNH